MLSCEGTTATARLESFSRAMRVSRNSERMSAVDFPSTDNHIKPLLGCTNTGSHKVRTRLHANVQVFQDLAQYVRGSFVGAYEQSR